jgi:hypothetical protein
MHQYAILFNPGHNRVYFEESKKLSLTELRAALPNIRLDERIEEICGVPYLLFQMEEALTSRELSVLPRLSFVYAAFELIRAEGQGMLRPLERKFEYYLDSGLSSLLKYSGKTNELFTRMMINLALLASDFAGESQIRLLDPVAGKGTALLEGLSLGYDVFGIEIGEKAANEACCCLKRYLEEHKLKHMQKSEKISGPNKIYTAMRQSFSIARTREEQKDGKIRSFTMVTGNSALADQFFAKKSFHLIVGDLPYGIQHGNVTNQKQTSLTRNPKELLQACLPGWRKVLMPGGAVALAWNRNVLPRGEMETLLEGAGFSIPEGDPNSLVHRVDQSILRDVVVARREK